MRKKFMRKPRSFLGIQRSVRKHGPIFKRTKAAHLFLQEKRLNRWENEGRSKGTVTAIQTAAGSDILVYVLFDGTLTYVTYDKLRETRNN
mmetsp:Transcript_36362/g.76304  ORF Transcript_36362/g.76304 Transcript_36362/m.76304 type:complete len:90 (+) Transcript_36362:1663-1932(+)